MLNDMHEHAGILNHRYTTPNRDWKQRHVPEIGVFRMHVQFRVLYCILVALWRVEGIVHFTRRRQCWKLFMLCWKPVPMYQVQKLN